MEKQELLKVIIYDEEKLDNIINTVKEALREEEGISTLTRFREKTPMHHNSFVKVRSYLEENDNDIIEIPASARGRHFIHKENLERIYQENFGEQDEQ